MRPAAPLPLWPPGRPSLSCQLLKDPSNLNVSLQAVPRTRLAVQRAEEKPLRLQAKASTAKDLGHSGHPLRVARRRAASRDLVPCSECPGRPGAWRPRWPLSRGRDAAWSCRGQRPRPRPARRPWAAACSRCRVGTRPVRTREVQLQTQQNELSVPYVSVAVVCDLSFILLH